MSFCPPLPVVHILSQRSVSSQTRHRHKARVGAGASGWTLAVSMEAVSGAFLAGMAANWMPRDWGAV